MENFEILANLYRDLKRREKILQAQIKEAQEEIKKACDYQPANRSGIRLEKVVRNGTIDYSSIPAVKMMSEEELEEYRQPSTNYWKISLDALTQ